MHVTNRMGVGKEEAGGASASPIFSNLIKLTRIKSFTLLLLHDKYKLITNAIVHLTVLSLCMDHEEPCTSSVWTESLLFVSIIFMHACSFEKWALHFATFTPNQINFLKRHQHEKKKENYL